MFYNEVFLQWSKSSTETFISITDLISYRKHKLNGLKLTLHFWRRYNESSFKCKAILWVTAEKVWNILAAWQLFLIVYKKTDEWRIEWQWVTTSDNEWYNEWQRISTSDTTSDNERMTTSDNEWQWVIVSANFLFFREELANRHLKENSLNLEEDLEKDLLNWEQI